MNREERLVELLRKVLDDATGDLNGKRVWAIRAALYREIAAEIVPGYTDFHNYRDESATV